MYSPSASSWSCQGFVTWAKPGSGRLLDVLRSRLLEHRRGCGDDVVGEVALRVEQLLREVERVVEDLLRLRQRVDRRDRRRLRGDVLHGARPGGDRVDNRVLALAD